MNLAPHVERVLLIRHLVVFRLAVCVDVRHAYSRRSPPTFLCGRRLATSSWYLGARYEAYCISALLHLGAHALCGHTKVICQCPFSEAFCRGANGCLYSSACPDASSITELHAGVEKRLCRGSVVADPRSVLYVSAKACRAVVWMGARRWHSR